MSIGIDTNVLVRHLVQDDPVQSVTASRLLARECSPQTPGLISQVVLCELVWVLAGSYGYDRQVIAATLKQLLRTTELEIAGASVVHDAVADYEAGAGDFADYLIGHLNDDAGAKHTVTFDKRAARHALFKLIK